MKLKPVIVQDANTKEVLMLAYANDAALQKTRETGNAWYFSRSRKKLWMKGEKSGNTQQVKEILEDCDKDALLYLVEQKGNACHTGKYSCFGAKKQFTLEDLEKIIAQRKKEMPKGSYTAKLLKSENLIYKKLKEECGEVIKAAKKEGKKRTIEEAADLLYFLEVLLGKKNISLAEVTKELGKRAG